MKGRGVPILHQTRRGTDTKMNLNAKCACGIVQRTTWVHRMLLVPLVSSHFHERAVRGSIIPSHELCKLMLIRIIRASIGVYEELESSPLLNSKTNVIVNVIIIAVTVILKVIKRSDKYARDIRAEIDVVGDLKEMYRLHVALLTANDHFDQVVLVYALPPASHRSLCCVERPLVVPRHRTGRQLCGLCSFRLPTS